MQTQFVVIKDALRGAALQQAQQRWSEVQAQAQASWEEEKRGGEGRDGLKFARGSTAMRRFFDVPDFFGSVDRGDDTFLDLLDLDAITPFVEAMAGNFFLNLLLLVPS